MNYSSYVEEKQPEKNYYVHMERVTNGWQIRCPSGIFVIQSDGSKDISELISTIEGIITKYE